MRSTGPVEVFFFVEFFSAIFAILQISIELSLSLDQPSDSLLQFLPLFN
jgi:hypothetical protein